MSILARFILFSFTNVTALLVASKLIKGFFLIDELIPLLTLSASLALINLTLKPILKLILSPLIVLSIGLFTFIINAGLLYLLDFLSPNLTINSLLDLGLATLITGTFNLLTVWSAKKSF